MGKAKVGLMLVLAGALALLALGSPALAKDGDVIVRGTCSATSTAKLKAERRERPDRGRARGRPEPERRPLDGRADPGRRPRRPRRPADAGAERLVHRAQAGRQPCRLGRRPRRRRDAARPARHGRPGRPEPLVASAPVADVAYIPGAAGHERRPAVGYAMVISGGAPLRAQRHRLQGRAPVRGLVARADAGPCDRRVSRLRARARC